MEKTTEELVTKVLKELYDVDSKLLGELNWATTTELNRRHKLETLENNPNIQKNDGK